MGTCPDYEVLFSNLGLYYVGRANVRMHGTYEAETPTNYSPTWSPNGLLQAVKVLQQYNFFDLSVVPSIVTDVPHLILAAERCRVTTKLDLADNGRRPDIEKLFDQLDAITDRVTWRKTSDSLSSPLGLLASILQ